MSSDTSQQPTRSGLQVSVRNSTEAKLWQEFKAGDEASFALIYQKFFPCLFSYGLKVCTEQEVVKDCIQDLFIYIWHHRASLADTDSIKYYLWTALKRRILRAISSSSAHSLDNPLMLPITEEGIEDILIMEEIAQERKEQLLSVMRLLTQRQRQAVKLKFFYNLKNEEIADRMSIGVASVYNLISKSLLTLRKGLVKHSIVGVALNYLLHH